MKCVNLILPRGREQILREAPEMIGAFIDRAGVASDLGYASAARQFLDLAQRVREYAASDGADPDFPAAWHAALDRIAEAMSNGPDSPSIVDAGMG